MTLANSGNYTNHDYHRPSGRQFYFEVRHIWYTPFDPLQFTLSGATTAESEYSVSLGVANTSYLTSRGVRGFTDLIEEKSPEELQEIYSRRVKNHEWILMIYIG
jgi:hypothetical protein